MTNAESAGPSPFFLNRWRVVRWAGAVLGLVLPWAAMQWTDEVVWTGMDFAAAGVLLVGGCGAYELAVSGGRSVRYRLAAGMALGTGVLLAWLSGAVGVFAPEGHIGNLLAAVGVLAVGGIGAGLVRARPQGLAHVLYAVALTVGVLAGTAAVTGLVPPGRALVALGVLSAGFIALFLGAARLFAHADAAR